MFFKATSLSPQSEVIQKSSSDVDLKSLNINSHILNSYVNISRGAFPSCSNKNNNNTLPTESSRNCSSHSITGESSLPLRRRSMSSPNVSLRSILKQCPSPARTHTPRKKSVTFSEDLEAVLAFNKYETPSKCGVNPCPTELTTTVTPSTQSSPATSNNVIIIRGPPDNSALQHKYRNSPVYLYSAQFDSASNILLGTVHVQNLAYQKHVSIRYTYNSWISQKEITADFSNSISAAVGSSPGIDRFSFILQIPHACDIYRSTSGHLNLELAIRYSVNSDEFWDNNYNANYLYKFVPTVMENERPKSVQPPLFETSRPRYLTNDSHNLNLQFKNYLSKTMFNDNSSLSNHSLFSLNKPKDLTFSSKSKLIPMNSIPIPKAADKNAFKISNTSLMFGSPQRRSYMPTTVQSKTQPLSQIDAPWTTDEDLDNYLYQPQPSYTPLSTFSNPAPFTESALSSMLFSSSPTIVHKSTPTDSLLSASVSPSVSPSPAKASSKSSFSSALPINSKLKNTKSDNIPQQLASNFSSIPALSNRNQQQGTMVDPFALYSSSPQFSYMSSLQT